MDLQAVRAIAVNTARMAGEELMRHYQRPHTEGTKSNVFDIVTDGDKASEAIIVAELMRHFPDHHIVGEEGGYMGAPAEDAEYFWYIDPIDGTTNFANNIPLFTVSIAMADRNMQPLVGVILNPVYNEMFSAAKGFGATLNDQPIHVSSAPTIERAVLSTGFTSERVSGEWSLRQWRALQFKTRGLRRLGSAALDCAFVASGRFDGFWEHTLNPWDIQAGLILVTEAGGTISDYSGGTDLLYAGKEVVCSNGLIHAEMLAALAEAK